jgi:hypothetical protein
MLIACMACITQGAPTGGWPVWSQRALSDFADAALLTLTIMSLAFSGWTSANQYCAIACESTQHTRINPPPAPLRLALLMYLTRCALTRCFLALCRPAASVHLLLWQPHLRQVKGRLPRRPAVGRACIRVAKMSCQSIRPHTDHIWNARCHRDVHASQVRPGGNGGSLGMVPGSLHERVHLHLQDPGQRLPLLPAPGAGPAAAFAPLATCPSIKGHL